MEKVRSPFDPERIHQPWIHLPHILPRYPRMRSCPRMDSLFWIFAPCFVVVKNDVNAGSRSKFIGGRRLAHAYYPLYVLRA